MQLPMFEPSTTWKATPIVDLPHWSRAKRVSIDCETKDLELKRLGPGVRRGAHIVGISFAIEDGPAHYLPIRHDGGGNLDAKEVLAWVAEEAAAFTGDLVGANLPYDMDFLQQAGVKLAPARYLDVQIAEPLLDELQDSYSLESIANRWGLPGKDEKLLRDAAEAYGVDPKKGLWQLPARFVGAYGEQDVRLPLQLMRRQERKLEEEELGAVWDMESRLLPVLLKMRRRGVAINNSRLDKVEVWALAQEREALALVSAATGIELVESDTTKPRALEPALVAIGLECPRTPTGLPSINNDWLKTVDHDVARGLMRAKKMNRLRNTFVKSIREHQVNGRINCTFNQLRRSAEAEGDDDEGARYGRVSCADPNMQQQPSKDPEIAPLWRAIYMPDEGCEWACLDYSQQEPRWLTHFATMLEAPGAAEMQQRYISDPLFDNHAGMALITGLERKYAKIIFLGLCYGMGGAKLCHSMDLPTKWVYSNRRQKMVEVAGDEGQAILDKFNAGAPFVSVTADAAQGKAGRAGFVRTALGRKCRFPLGPKGYEFTHKALNRVVQGSSGDQTKMAMVLADEADIPIQLQVHDELDLSIGNRGVADALSEIMRNAIPCSVPSKVDVEIGPSWGEIE